METNHDHHWLFKPGVVQNPRGLNGANTHTRRLEIIKALNAELNEPCERAGFEHLTKFQMGIKVIVELYQRGEPWAVKEVHSRVFGRVPYQLSVGMREPSADLSALTIAELAERAQNLVRMAASVDGSIVEQKVGRPPAETVALGDATLPLDGAHLDRLEAMVAEDTLPADPAELRQMIARLELELAQMEDQ